MPSPRRCSTLASPFFILVRALFPLSPIYLYISIYIYNIYHSYCGVVDGQFWDANHVPSNMLNPNAAHPYSTAANKHTNVRPAAILHDLSYRNYIYALLGSHCARRRSTIYAERGDDPSTQSYRANPRHGVRLPTSRLPPSCLCFKAHHYNNFAC